MKKIIAMLFLLMLFHQLHAQSEPAKRSRKEAFELISKIYLQLTNAEISFCSAAVLYSEDPSSNNKCGDLGLWEKGVFVAEFENVLWQLPANSLSVPFLTQFGYMLVEVLEKKEDKCHSRIILITFEKA